jgi:importin subunit beta-1
MDKTLTASLGGQRAWPELVPGLLGLALNAALPSGTKEATVRAIGYLCMELDLDCLEEAEVDQILTAVVSAMAPTNPAEVRRAATAAMYELLLFANENMGRDAERNAIVQAIGQSSQDSDPRARRNAFNCISRLAGEYYDYLPPYFEALGQATFTAAAEGARSGGDTELGSSALEFWFEITEQEQNRESTGDGVNAEFCKKSLLPLTNLLLTIMGNQEDEDEEDGGMEGGLTSSAAALLGDVVLTVGSPAADPIMAYVQSNLTNPEWNKRNAATYAIGKLVAGLVPEDTQKMTALLSGMLPGLLQRIANGPMRDTSVAVRDTSAWAVGAILESQWEAVRLMGVSSFLPPLVAALRDGVSDVPRVACQSAYALFALSKGAMYEVEMSDANGNENPENPLSPYLEDLVNFLVARGYGNDWEESNVRSSCFEAIGGIVESSKLAPADQPVLAKILSNTLSTLRTLIGTPMPAAQAAAESWVDFVQRYTTLLETLVRTLGDPVGPFAKDIMELSMALFAVPKAALDDVFRLITAVSAALDSEFTSFLPLVREKLLHSLADRESTAVVQAATTCAGQLANATGESFSFFARDVVVLLLEGLKSAEMDREVKIEMLSAIGDVFLAIGGHMCVLDLVPVVLSSVGSAASTEMPRDEDGEMDSEDADYLMRLRCACVEAWAGVLLGFNEDKYKQHVATAIGPSAPVIARFIQGWCKEQVEEAKASSSVAEKASKAALLAVSTDDFDGELITSLIGLVGDIADVFGSEAAQGFFHPRTMDWAGEAVQLVHSLDLQQWDGNNRDEDGNVRLTAAQNCLQRLNVKMKLNS